VSHQTDLAGIDELMLELHETRAQTKDERRSARLSALDAAADVALADINQWSQVRGV
jgi:hypothetical protein